tara:strand:- start:66 stop:194 length:129 start_codon:yes stop_codon:yes gene_type:complete
VHEKLFFGKRRLTDYAKNVVDIDGKIRRREFECTVHHVIERI